MTEVSLVTTGRIACITLNRPDKLNAFNKSMYVAFNDAMRAFNNDPDLWVAIISGAGKRAFSAGVDVEMLGGIIDSEGNEGLQSLDIELEAEFATAKPVIAAIRGYCIGEGMSLASSCDFRIAADDATFGWTEPRIGMPTINGALKATHILGLGHALELLLLGERVDSAWAMRTGFVNKVVSSDEVDAEAMRWAQKLCLLGPQAVRATKEVAIRGLRMNFDEAIQLGLSLRAPIANSDDAAEGARAFAEKRQPMFTGR